MTRSTVKGVLALAAAVSLWVLALPVGAASLDASGWWWRAQTGLGGIQAPTPPDVPEGGLLVESTPQGATAIAGVRFELRPHEVQPTLTLTVADAANTGDAVLAACPAGGEWQAAHGGSWDDKPPAACGEGSVAGIPADDGSEWTFPVSALVPIFEEGTIDVVVVPGKTETGANPSFRIAFERPTSRSLQTSRRASEVSVPSAGGSANSDPVATATTDDSGASTSSAPAITRPTSSTPEPIPEPVFDPALEPEDQEVTSSAPLRRVGTAASEDDRPGHWVAVVVLTLGATTIFWLFRQPLREPRRLGSMAARHVGDDEDPGEVRGVGRFRRPRSGEASVASLSLFDQSHD